MDSIVNSFCWLVVILGYIWTLPLSMYKLWLMIKMALFLPNKIISEFSRLLEFEETNHTNPYASLEPFYGNMVGVKTF